MQKCSKSPGLEIIVAEKESVSVIEFSIWLKGNKDAIEMERLRIKWNPSFGTTNTYIPKLGVILLNMHKKLVWWREVLREEYLR